MEDVKVVILCGGKGTRAYPFTEYMPKVMMPINGTPILVHLMKLYAAQGFNNFVLAAGHRQEMLHDYIDTGGRWGDLAHASDPEAKYYVFLWNCLWRAGASLLHGHAQVIMGRGMHYAAVEQLRRSAAIYQAHERANYFNDLFLAHQSVGCAFEKDGTKVIANLTPKKENEVLLFAPFVTTSLKDRIYEVLECYRDRLGVTSFNLVIYTPPWSETPESWEGFPVMVRIVDRGDPSSRTADFGAMELYAASVVSSDPFALARNLATLIEKRFGNEEWWSVVRERSGFDPAQVSSQEVSSARISGTPSSNACCADLESATSSRTSSCQASSFSST